MIATDTYPKSAEETSKEHLRILVVDDEPHIRELIREYLSRFDNIETLEAANAFKALEIVQTQEIDGVILDIYMPGMDGLELLRRLKKINRHLIIILMTGYPSFDCLVEAIRSGASDFLPKPFKLTDLQLAVERLSRERKLIVENLNLTAEQAVLRELNDRLKKKIREQSILFSISEALSRVKSTLELYQKVTHLAHRLTEADAAFFWIANTDEAKLITMAEVGERKILSPYRCLSLSSDSGLVKVFKEGLPAMYVQDSRRQLQGFSGSLIAVPFAIREETLGILAAARKPDRPSFSEEDLFTLHLLVERASLNVENLILYESILLNLHSTLRALVTTLEAKDPYTKEHSQRVTEWAVKIAKQMNLPEEEIDSLRFAAQLHDIGKIGIRDHILMKPGRLTPEEYEIIKKHPVIGEEIVSHLGLLPQEKAIIRHHHERWDGKGYPDGLQGEEIPLLSRILAVADAFDALTSTRPYRKAMSYEEALAELERNKWTQFDGRAVEALVKIISKESDHG